MFVEKFSANGDLEQMSDRQRLGRRGNGRNDETVRIFCHQEMFNSEKDDVDPAIRFFGNIVSDRCAAITAAAATVAAATTVGKAAIDAVAPLLQVLALSVQSSHSLLPPSPVSLQPPSVLPPQSSPLLPPLHAPRSSQPLTLSVQPPSLL